MKPRRNFYWRKWRPHVLYDFTRLRTVNQGNRERLWMGQKQRVCEEPQTYGSWRNSRADRHHARGINKKCDGGESFPARARPRARRCGSSGTRKSGHATVWHKVCTFKTTFHLFRNMDPSVIQALKPKQRVEGGVIPNRITFREIRKQKKQVLT